MDLLLFSSSSYGIQDYFLFFSYIVTQRIKLTLCPKFGENCVTILTWIAQGSNYLSFMVYGVMHRMHHFFADMKKTRILQNTTQIHLANDVENENICSTNRSSKNCHRRKNSRKTFLFGNRFISLPCSWYFRIG